MRTRSWPLRVFLAACLLPLAPAPTSGAEAAAGAAVDAAPLPGPPLPDGVVVPPGAHDDVVLWKRALDSQNELAVERSKAQTLLRRFSAERHDARLAAAGGRSGNGAPFVTARQKLGTAWASVSRLMSRQWPVDPRLMCRAQHSDLEGTLHAAPGSSMEKGLPQARLALQGCLAKLVTILEPLRKGNQLLAGALAEADGLLQPAAPQEEAP